MAKVGFVGVLRLGGQEIGEARDVTLNTSAEMVETSKRSDAGWKTWLQGWKEWTVDFDAIFENVSPGLDVIRTAYLAGSTLSLSMLDDDGEGITGTILVESWPKAEPLKDVMTRTLTLRGTGPFQYVNAAS